MHNKWSQCTRSDIIKTNVTNLAIGREHLAIGRGLCAQQVHKRRNIAPFPIRPIQLQAPNQCGESFQGCYTRIRTTASAAKLQPPQSHAASHPTCKDNNTMKCQTQFHSAASNASMFRPPEPVTQALLISAPDYTRVTSPRGQGQTEAPTPTSGHCFDPPWCINHERLLECNFHARAGLPAPGLIKISAVAGSQDLNLCRRICPIHFRTQCHAARVQNTCQNPTNIACQAWEGTPSRPRSTLIRTPILQEPTIKVNNTRAHDADRQRSRITDNPPQLPTT